MNSSLNVGKKLSVMVTEKPEAKCFLRSLHGKNHHNRVNRQPAG